MEKFTTHLLSSAKIKDFGETSPNLNKFGGLITNKKGVALILTFIFMTVLTVVIGGYLFMVTVETRSAATQLNNIQALYLAESALNHAVYYLTNTAPDSSTDGSWRTTAYPAAPGAGDTDPQQENLGNGTYTMWAQETDPVSSNILVMARGTVGGIERIIQETITLGSGVWYVDGRVTINDDVTMNGTIVATGDIVLTNTDNFTSTPEDNYPSLVSDASITGSRMGSATINGLVYASTSIDFPRATNNTINGSLVSGGDMDFSRSSGWSITYDADLASDPPPYFGGSLDAFDDALYSDGDMDFNSASGSITGDLEATGTVDDEGGMTITGSTTESSSTALPTVTLSSYESDADTVISGNHTFSSGTYGGSASGAGWDEI